MWFLSKDFRFEAAHRLVRHDGKCSRKHGHSFRGTITVAGDRLHESGPKRGMVIDYGDLSTALGPLLEHYLDHWDLNETLGDFMEDPTSEAIAQWIYIRLRPILPSIVSITIEETCTARCVYMPNYLPTFAPA